MQQFFLILIQNQSLAMGRSFLVNLVPCTQWFSSLKRKAEKGNTGQESIEPIIVDYVTALPSSNTLLPCLLNYCFSPHINLQPQISNTSFLMSTGSKEKASLLFTRSTLVSQSKSPNLGNSRGNNSKKSLKYIKYSHKIRFIPLLYSIFSFLTVTSSSST